MLNCFIALSVFTQHVIMFRSVNQSFPFPYSFKAHSLVDIQICTENLNVVICSTLYTVYTQAARAQNPPPAPLKQDIITVLLSVSPFYGGVGRVDGKQFLLFVSFDFAELQFQWTGSSSKTDVITKERSSWSQRAYFQPILLYLFSQCRESGSNSLGAAQCFLDELSAKHF